MRLTIALTAAAVAASLGFTSTAFAYGQGDFFTRLGVAKVAPKSDNGDFDALGISDVDVSDKSGFAFTLGYRFLDQLGLELLAAERFEHEISLDGAEIASTKHLPPTLTLQYYPLGGTDARVQPYVGAGVNYTRFSSEQLAVGDLELDNSWGYAAQLGVDLLIADHWALNAAAWYLDIDSDATATVGGQGYDTEVEIDPLVVMGGLGFYF